MSYGSNNIMNNMSTHISNVALGLRTLALLAFVGLSTAVLVQPELIGGSAPATTLAIGSIPAITHH